MSLLHQLPVLFCLFFSWYSPTNTFAILTNARVSSSTAIVESMVTTLPDYLARSEKSITRQVPSRATMPGNRLDTNFNAFPVQSHSVSQAAPLWLRKKGNGSPTYVIDGKMATAGQLRKLRQSEVASINVLDGAKAASLYGKNTQNGMVIITTKVRSKSIP